MRSDDMPMMHTDDEGLTMARSNRSPEDDVSSNDGDRDLRSHCENPAMVAERDLVLQTLCEIERICYQLVDANQVEPQGDPANITDVIAQPSLLTPRTQVCLFTFMPLVTFSLRFLWFNEDQSTRRERCVRRLALVRTGCLPN